MNIYDISEIRGIAKEEISAYGETQAKKDWSERAERAKNNAPDFSKATGEKLDDLLDAAAIWKSYAEGRIP